MKLIVEPDLAAGARSTFVLGSPPDCLRATFVFGSPPDCLRSTFVLGNPPDCLRSNVPNVRSDGAGLKMGVRAEGAVGAYCRGPTGRKSKRGESPEVTLAQVGGCRTGELLAEARLLIVRS